MRLIRLWRQGITLMTPETSHWTPEQIVASNAVERCLVFANFHIEDGGRSRQLVATCATESDAQFIAAAPEMFELIERASEIMIELESLADRAFTNDAFVQKSQWHKDAAALLAKIEGGEA